MFQQNRVTIIQFETHSVLDLVILKGDMVFVSNIPFLDTDFLGTGSYRIIAITQDVPV